MPLTGIWGSPSNSACRKEASAERLRGLLNFMVKKFFTKVKEYTKNMNTNENILCMQK